MIYTYALLEISGLAFDEIKGKLIASGYSDQFKEVDGKIVIDMHGIGLTRERDPNG
mgnify:CR=1 FL=1